MVDFFGGGDELILETDGISWLIWIQILVTVLLLILFLFGFSTIFSFDLSSPTDPTSSSYLNGCTTSLLSATTHQSRANNNGGRPLLATRGSTNTTKVKGNQSMKADTGPSTNRAETKEEEEVQERDESSTKEVFLSRIFRNPHHPCNFLGAAKQAFLKCLGLDSSSENHCNRKHTKQD